jgi:hypothetical protein
MGGGKEGKPLGRGKLKYICSREAGCGNLRKRCCVVLVGDGCTLGGATGGGEETGTLGEATGCDGTGTLGGALAGGESCTLGGETGMGSTGGGEGTARSRRVAISRRACRVLSWSGTKSGSAGFLSLRVAIRSDTASRIRSSVV